MNQQNYNKNNQKKQTNLDEMVINIKRIVPSGGFISKEEAENLENERIEEENDDDNEWIGYTSKNYSLKINQLDNSNNIISKLESKLKSYHWLRFSVKSNKLKCIICAKFLETIDLKQSSFGEGKIDLIIKILNKSDKFSKHEKKKVGQLFMKK